jgi:hypothetical protein
MDKSTLLGTIVIAALLGGCVLAIIISMVRRKRKGQCVGCDCRCGDCCSSHDGIAMTVDAEK